MTPALFILSKVIVCSYADCSIFTACSICSSVIVEKSVSMSKADGNCSSAVGGCVCWRIYAMT